VRWIKNLGLLVKLWGKNSNLIGKNYLSSYAMILMLIHYLIKVKKAKPILDNRVITNDKPHFEYKRLKQA
jgi:DNA polymerase sigma